jgi:hypothetical protein
METQMSEAVTRQEEYRALQHHDHVPAAHIAVMVTGFDFDPHLRRGELAIVDTGDKTLQFGELYVITLSEGTPHMSLAIVQLLREKVCMGGAIGLMYGFSFAGRGGLMFKGERLRYVDGPLGIEHWPGKCVGRIVGVMQPRWEGREIASEVRS